MTVKFPTLLIEVTGVTRSGIAAKSQKPYTMFQAFVHLPGIPYPQKTDFYAQNQAEVPQPGTYECDVVADVRDGRLEFTVDPRQGRRKNIPPLSDAMNPQKAG
ncbi:propanediol utilization protein [Pseudomonas savastanoi]|uniref:Prophage PSPPH05, helix-destabilizing protein n=4 Tax=Pseudomonas savastanoi TaxID=29438 RepID=A0AB74B7U1_PSESG|nr:propanediol utilization protein [Pseudomonas savastanoi]KPX41149.1 Prophage PSPPH05, helix-destabilizing protein [Pseudomonas savastanoi pv. glycinea]PYD22095.1 propanediol utilization protein [Pseudomonas savastanoi pv. glycinea]RMM74450.1 Prophage PSPPH05, helix-destabilizing protein [Pseudomonas savastanoi pv. glycinea]RMM91413.1 Prophage PSPPH05, helix-destabilizing protein [Pseudomonas savastanoi pv. glycinea]RMN01036.1 Prophage PSPPH05, helix-destabilizing protein [Pseudomonas savasta